VSVLVRCQAVLVESLPSIVHSELARVLAYSFGVLAVCYWSLIPSLAFEVSFFTLGANLGNLRRTVGLRRVASVAFR